MVAPSTPSHRNGADNRLGRHSPNLCRLRRTRLRVGAAAPIASDA